MPVFHTFTAGGKRYMFDANTNVIINLKEDLYFELEKYMQSGYKEITPAIEKLRDRGYLKDRADFEMVHPMDSTLEYSLERCIGTIALQVTQGCNLRCKYCAYSGSYDNRVHSSKRMSKEIAFKAIDFLFDHSIDRDRVSLGFYGGEPLLELDLIKECVKYAKKKSIGKELMFNITSNTTLITDEVLKFLYDNEFSLTVSLDGDRQAHDKNRVFAANGAGTFSVVMQILEKIQTQYPDYMERVHINAVIDPTTDFDCTSNFFSDYKTVKDFYIQANLISEYYRKDEVATDEEYATDPSEWVIVENTHEPLVDKETFEKAQERVKEISDAYFAKEFTKHPPNEKNLLKGKIVCGDCGKGMRLSPRTTKSYVYFCGTFSDGINPACSRHKIDQEDVNKAVFAQISNHMRCCIDALRVIRELNARSSGLKKYDVYEKAITRQRRELEKVNRKFSELYGDYSEHLINESEYLTLKQQYLLKSEALKKEIDNLLISQNLYSKNYKIDADWENLINKYLKCRKLNKELADAFVDKVQVFEGGRISVNLVYEELLQVKNKREGDLNE